MLRLMSDPPQPSRPLDHDPYENHSYASTRVQVALLQIAESGVL